MKIGILIFCIIGVVLIAIGFAVPVVMYLRFRRTMRRHIKNGRSIYEKRLMSQNELVLFRAFLDAVEYCALKDEAFER